MRTKDPYTGGQWGTLRGVERVVNLRHDVAHVDNLSVRLVRIGKLAGATSVAQSFANLGRVVVGVFVGRW